MNLSDIIAKYISNVSDEYHRYRSWNHCHEAFNSSLETLNHSLELAFYLASWGMYRGSSGLLQTNRLIHNGAIDILLSPEFQKINCKDTSEVSKDNIEIILLLKKRLAEHYSNIKFIKGTNNPKSITPTDTLLSKIMLGTLCCVPAYDRYFISGLREMKFVHTHFNKASLVELFAFIERNKIEIVEMQKAIKAKTSVHYPVMKILDMYFWQIGYDKEILTGKI